MPVEKDPEQIYADLEMVAGCVFSLDSHLGPQG